VAALRLINLHVVEVIRCWLPRFRSQQLSGSSYFRQHARLSLRVADPFWQARYYDLNVWSERKFIEKLRYIHRNLVTRGLVVPPGDWVWSSFRHYANGEEGSSRDRVAVDGAKQREGRYPPDSTEACNLVTGPPKQSLDGHPRESGWLRSVRAARPLAPFG